MAYRVECNKTVSEFFDNLVNFLTSPVSFDAPDYSQSQGNGNIANINFNYDNAQTEEWRITYDANNNKFTVYGTVSGSQPDAYLNQPYDNGIISFTIEEGDQAWQDGDVVTIKAVKSNNPPFKLINQGLYRNDLKAEINGTYGYDVYCNKFYNTKIDDKNFIGAVDSIKCNSIINSEHKFRSDCSFFFDMYVNAFTNYAQYEPHFMLTNVNSDNVSNRYYFVVFDFSNFTFYFKKGYYQYNPTSDILDFSNFIDYFNKRYFFTLNYKTNGDFTLYINGQEVGTINYSDFVNAEFNMDYIYSANPLSSFYMWNRNLTTTEINDIINNNGYPTEDTNDYYFSLLNNKNFQKYAIFSTNKNGFLLLTTEGGQFLNVVDGRFLPISPFLLGCEENFEFRIDFYYKKYDNNVTINLGKDLTDKISKYWIIQNGESVLLAFKKEDYTKVDHPVYQLFYIGWTQGDTEYDYPVIIGMNKDKFNWWETNNSNYRFGLMYSRNMLLWENYDLWDTNIALSNTLSNSWQNITNDNNYISVIGVNIVKSQSTSSSGFYLHKNNSSSIFYNYGLPYWLYMVNFSNIAPETEIYIDGEKYVVIPDNEDVTDYKYLIKLEG